MYNLFFPKKIICILKLVSGICKRRSMISRCRGIDFHTDGNFLGEVNFGYFDKIIPSYFLRIFFIRYGQTYFLLINYILHSFIHSFIHPSIHLFIILFIHSFRNKQNTERFRQQAQHHVYGLCQLL